MKSFLAVVVLLGCVGCSTSGPKTGEDDASGNEVALITRPDGQNDSIWSTGRGHLRVEAGCILFKGELAVFPYGTTLVNGANSLQIDGEEAIALDGSALVDAIGSEVPIGKDGDWDHAMDAENLARWTDCRRRADISEYADWWQIGQIRLVGDG